MPGEVMEIVGQQEGEVIVGVLRPSGRVSIDVESFAGLVFEEPEHVDLFLGWVQEAKRLAEHLRQHPEHA